MRDTVVECRRGPARRAASRRFHRVGSGIGVTTAHRALSGTCAGAGSAARAGSLRSLGARDPRSPHPRPRRRRPVAAPRRRSRRRPRPRGPDGPRRSRRPSPTPGSRRSTEVDSIRVVGLLSWKYGNASQVLGDRHRASRATSSPTPRWAATARRRWSNSTALAIQAGELDVALLVGRRVVAHPDAGPQAGRRARLGEVAGRLRATDARRGPRDEPSRRDRPPDRDAGAGVPDVRDGHPGRRRPLARGPPRADQRAVVALQRTWRPTTRRRGSARRRPPRRSAPSAPTTAWSVCRTRST